MGNCDAEVDQMLLDFPIGAPYVVLPAEGQTVGKRLVDALPCRFVQRLGAQRDAVALPDVGIRWNAHSAPW